MLNEKDVAYITYLAGAVVWFVLRHCDQNEDDLKAAKIASNAYDDLVLLARKKYDELSIMG